MQTQDEDSPEKIEMNEIIEADFFPPAVQEIKDTSHTLIVDNGPDATHSVEPRLTKAGGPFTFEASETKASSKRTES
jgi:hypothetical protein